MKNLLPTLFFAALTISAVAQGSLKNGNIMDFYVNGDMAPGGRFNFLYIE
jgi:hypothetical protein